VPVHAAIVLPWLAGVAALSAWRVCGWLVLRRMVRRHSRPAARPVRLAGETLRARMGVTRAVRLVESAWVQVPAVVGVLRPVILLPAGALSGLTMAQLESILAHELAHVRRHDYVVNLLQAAAETLLFYHPAVWWVSRRVREERELCCDDEAAAACGDRVLYARALADLEALRAPPAALALSARGGSLARRVRRLLGVDEPIRPAPVAGILAACCVVLAMAAARLTSAQDAAKPAPAKAADASPAAAGEAPRDEDFVADSGDYRVGPGDQLTISVTGLQGPNVETIKQARVSNTGSISMPYIGAIAVAGRTEVEVERDIVDKYKAAHLLEAAAVSVVVSEAKQDVFSVMGDVARPGPYRLAQQDYRLLDALAASGAGNDVQQILVIRRPADGGRVISVPGARLLAGDLKYNVVVRRGDVVRVTGGKPLVARLVVRPDGKLSLDGRDLTWEQLGDALGRGDAAARGRTTLLLVPGSDDMTLRQLREAKSRAEAAATRAGLKGIDLQIAAAVAESNDAGAEPPGKKPARKTRSALPEGPGSTEGEYFLGGSVTRPGAYAINANGVRLRPALVAGGLAEGAPANYEVFIYRKWGDKEEYYRLDLAEVLGEKSRNGSAWLRDGDQVLVAPRKGAKSE
jgi:protein involved in polysaccharide export with SLBB domain